MTLKEFAKIALTIGGLTKLHNKSHMAGLMQAGKFKPESLAKTNFLTKFEAKHSNFLGRVKEEYGPGGRIMKKGRRLALQQPGIAPGATPNLGTAT